MSWGYNVPVLYTIKTMFNIKNCNKKTHIQISTADTELKGELGSHMPRATNPECPKYWTHAQQLLSISAATKEARTKDLACCKEDPKWRS